MKIHSWLKYGTQYCTLVHDKKNFFLMENLRCINELEVVKLSPDDCYMVRVSSKEGGGGGGGGKGDPRL